MALLCMPSRPELEQRYEQPAYQPVHLNAAQASKRTSSPRSLQSQVQLQESEVTTNGDDSNHMAWLPKSESMEVTNDPRFMANSVIAKRLAAFHVVSVVAALMVKLSVKQLFLLQKDVDLGTARGVVQYVGFLAMSVVFLLDLFVVIVVVQQLFMAFRLLTAGPSGFEAAKSFYLESNVVGLRHLAARGVLISLPLFVASTGCMVFVDFAKSGRPLLALPAFLLLGVGSAALCFVNAKHSSIFEERYALAKSFERPLLNRLDVAATRSRSRSFPGLDV